jgi:hypothetical protein
MQFGAAGSTVHGPVTVKNCALVKPTIMIRKTPHGPPMRGRPGGYWVDSIFGTEPFLRFGFLSCISLMDFVD